MTFMMIAWKFFRRIRRACFSFTGVSVEVMALLMLLSWEERRGVNLRLCTACFYIHKNITGGAYNRHITYYKVSVKERPEVK